MIKWRRVLMNASGAVERARAGGVPARGKRAAGVHEHPSRLGAAAATRRDGPRVRGILVGRAHARPHRGRTSALLPGYPYATPDAVAQLLAETRTRRLAHVTGDLVPGVNAIAAPIFDEKGRIAAAIGALGRPEDLDVDFGGKVAAALTRTAEEISRRLGYSLHE